MAQYYNLKNILDDLKLIQRQHKMLNSFGTGDLTQLIYLTQDNDKKPNTGWSAPIYPLLYVIPQQIQREENFVTYNLSVICADKLNTRNFDNEIDASSDTAQILSDVLAQFKYSVTDNQGNYYSKYDLALPSSMNYFSERYDDILVGWTMNLQVIVSDPLNRCLAPFDPFPITPSITPTNTPTVSITPTQTPTNTSTPTVTPTCPVTEQYLEVQLSENTKFKLILWNDAGYTSPATANCDYTISGVAYGDLGTIYYGTEQILQGQHQKQFNLAPVLLPGEVVVGFSVLGYTLSGCPCPVLLNFPSPSPTPTQTPTVTPTYTPTHTPTPTPPVEYYILDETGDILETEGGDLIEYEH
jgi:hypothetical protein